MLTSLDGKIIGDYLKEERAAYYRDFYEKIHDRYGCKAWMCGAGLPWKNTLLWDIN